MQYIGAYIILLVFTRLLFRVFQMLFFDEKEFLINSIRKIKEKDFFKGFLLIVFNYLFYSSFKQFTIKPWNNKPALIKSFHILNYTTYIIPIIPLLIISFNHN